MSDSLQLKMRKVEGYHTRGANRPKFYLVHRDDYAYLTDLLAAELEWKRRNFGIEVMTFAGIVVVESELAKKGEPLVVMGLPGEAVV